MEGLYRGAPPAAPRAMLQKLGVELEKFEAAYKVDLVVTPHGGYSPPGSDDGRTDNSGHRFGAAVDVRGVKTTPQRLFILLRRARRAGLISSKLRFVFYPNKPFVHVDQPWPTRPKTGDLFRDHFRRGRGRQYLPISRYPWWCKAHKQRNLLREDPELGDEEREPDDDEFIGQDAEEPGPRAGAHVPTRAGTVYRQPDPGYGESTTAETASSPEADDEPAQSPARVAGERARSYIDNGRFSAPAFRRYVAATRSIR